MSRALLAVSLFICASTLPKNEQATLRNGLTVNFIQSQGYHVETHHVVTEDGYILEMHRIPYKRYENKSVTIRPVVFMMHGLYGASVHFIFMGHEHSIGYNLADAGFDVWMGNARGSTDSRFHQTLDPDDEVEKFKFFDFSIEEIGIYDVAAMVDYILNYTGQVKLHYIGHSQGGTVFLILNSFRPEYNDKFISAHLLAGVGYMDYFPNTQLSIMAQFTDVIYSVALEQGFVEMYPSMSLDIERSDNNGVYFCTDSHFKFMCDTLNVPYKIHANVSRSELELDSNLPGGGALKQIAHYGQNIRDKAFRRWNYGITQNIEVYGTENPPIYNLSVITVNTTMHYTVNDDLLDERDVLAMANDMPNAIVRRVARESFLHEDFVTAIDAKALVTDYIAREISAVEFARIGNSDENNEGETVIDAESTNSAPGITLGIIFKTYLTGLSLIITGLHNYR